VRRPAVLPAEQHAVIGVVGPEVAPLLVELLDVRLQDGQRERVKAPPLRGAAGRRQRPASAMGRPGRRASAHAFSPR
jgi:hypothetical protein